MGRKESGPLAKRETGCKLTKEEDDTGNSWKEQEMCPYESDVGVRAEGGTVRTS